MAKINLMICGIMGGYLVASAQVDTIITSETKFTFPESRPGQTFVVRKIIIDSGISRRKFSGGNDSANINNRALTHDSSSTKRDVLGRVAHQTKSNPFFQVVNKQLATSTIFDSSGKTLYTKKSNHFEPHGKWHSQIVSTSPLIKNPKDLVLLEKAEASAIRKKYGVIDPPFSKKLDTMSSEDTVDITVSLAIEAPPFLRRDKATKQERIDNAKLWAHPKILRNKNDILTRFNIKEIENRYAFGLPNTFRTKTTKSNVLAMAKITGITEIVESVNVTPASFHWPSSTVQLQTLINSGYNPPNEMVNQGGSATADFALGLRLSYLDCLSSGLHPDGFDTLSEWGFDSTLDDDDHAWTRSHSEATYQLIAEGAPGNMRYSFKDGGGETFDDKGLQSTNFSECYGWSETFELWRYMDRQAYLWPYPTLSFSACDGGYDVVTDGLGYNIMSVGNVQHHNLSHYRLFEGSGDQFTQTKNPPAKYGSEGDRELPYIVAPGQTPYDDSDFSDLCICTRHDTAWNPQGGTSFSSPVASAMATNVDGAIITQYNPEVLPPEWVRAALLVTAQNVDSGYWDPTNHDGRDGAGTVSGSNAVQFILNSTITGPFGSDPATNGLDIEYLDQYSYDGVGGPFGEYYVQTPSSLPSGKHLRVVLTWDSSPGVDSIQNELPNLDLLVGADFSVYLSQSWNGNVEMVDIPNEAISPNTVYPIDVIPMIFRMAADGPDHTYFAIAWTWVKDHAE